MPHEDRGTAMHASEVRLRLLGGFGATVAGVLVDTSDWPTQRSMQLVQLLALAEGRRLPRERVIDLLWPQLAPDAGAANLRKAAHMARRALRQVDAVVLKSEVVSLFPSGGVAIDSEQFEQAAQAALAARDPEACARASELYTGDLLPDAVYDEWLEAPRERLRARFLQLLRVSAQWQRLAEADPTDEPAHRELMRAALASGHRPAAIGWYGRLRSALRHSLGVAPDRATEALFERCVEDLRLPASLFVGRDYEMAQATAWLSARTDRAGGLAITGPGGVGKSTFLARVGDAARARGWSVVAAEATQATGPYAVIAELADRLLFDDRALAERLPIAARSVLALLSPLAAPAAPLSLPLGRQQVIGAIRRLLLAAAGERPLLLCIDDAHLLEEADADALLQLAVTGRPLQLAFAMRPTPAATTALKRVPRLVGSGQLLFIELQPLRTEDAQLLVSLAAARPLPAPVVARIVELAAGNPFAALELARAATEAGDALPTSAVAAVVARLVDVDERALVLLKRLALAGDEFDAATAQGLAARDQAEAHDLLDAALAAGVLVVSGANYRFRHELVRQALVEQVPPHQRLKIHRESAQRLGELGAPASAIARHWLAGGSPEQAMPHLLAAAREAMRLGAYRDALPHLDALLAHAPTHADALRLRAEALDFLGEHAAIPAYGAAAEAAGEIESHDLRAKGALAQIKQGDPRGALKALQGVEPTTVEGRLAEALTYAGAAALGVTDPALGTHKAAEARRLALQTGDTGSIVVASWAQAAAAHARGELHTSVWADLLDTHHLPELAVRVFDGHLCITQRFLYGARPYAEVMRFADALAAEARRLGAARGEAFGVTLRGEAELLSGELEAAEEHLTLGGRLHRAIGGATGEALALQRRAELAAHRGQRREAQSLLDEALDLARQSDIGFHLFDRIYGARIALQEDPHAALAELRNAQECVQGPLETCPGCRITFVFPAAIAAARAGDLDLAHKYEEQCAYLADVVMRLPAWSAALDEVRGHLAAAGGERAKAAARFASAARGYSIAGQPLDVSRCARLVGTEGG